MRRPLIGALSFWDYRFAIVKGKPGSQRKNLAGSVLAIDVSLLFLASGALWRSYRLGAKGRERCYVVGEQLAHLGDELIIGHAAKLAS